MMEYVNKNSEDESKYNTGSIDNNQKRSSSKQNDQGHKSSPKKSKSDDESSELNPEQALEYVSQDSEDESKMKASTTDKNQKSYSSNYNDQAYEGSPKKSQFNGAKGTDVEEGKKNCEIDEKSAPIDEKGNIAFMEQKKCNLNSHKDMGANGEELMPKCKTNVNTDVNVVRRQIFKKE